MISNVGLMPELIVPDEIALLGPYWLSPENDAVTVVDVV